MSPDTPAGSAAGAAGRGAGVGARRARGQDARRPRRRRDRRRTAGRSRQPRLRARSPTTSTIPSAASGGGTTTRRSAGWCSTCDPDDGVEQFRGWWPTPTSCSRAKRRARSPRSDSTTHELRAANERLIWVSVTPFGSEGTRAHEPATDLTLLAGGGPAWSCGYDDHTLPPVRGGGNQAFHIGSTWAVMGALTAVLARDVTGRGQHVDVSMHAACNVTTEMGTYGYLAGHETVLRQTGRHAMPTISMPTQMRCADGALRHHRLPAALAARLRVVARLDRDPRLPRASSPRRCCSTSPSSAVACRSRRWPPTTSPATSSAPDARR